MLAAYCGLIVALGALRVCAEGWLGMPIREPDDRRLLEVVLLHLAFAAVLLGIGRLLRRRAGTQRRALRLLAAATPLLMLVSADRICAYFIPPPTGATRVFMRDAELGWRHRPGAEDFWTYSRVAINAKGLRGPEVPYEKGPDECRILFLGDSITFAMGVPYEEGFVSRVEGLLTGRIDRRRIRTIACAVSGYSPWQEAILLQQEGLKYQPDLVVQCFCLNDVTEPFKLTKYGGEDIGLEAENAASGALESSGIWRLACYVRGRIERARNRGKTPPGLARLDEKQLWAEHDSPAVQEAWRATREEMDKIIGTCRGSGIPLVIVCFPDSDQVNSEACATWPQQELAAFCRERRIACLDLLPAMREQTRANPAGPPLLIDWCHPTSTGHALVAERIAEFLSREGLLCSEVGHSGAQDNRAGTSNGPPGHH